MKLKAWKIKRSDATPFRNDDHTPDGRRESAVPPPFTHGIPTNATLLLGAGDTPRPRDDHCQATETTDGFDGNLRSSSQANKPSLEETYIELRKGDHATQTERLESSLQPSDFIEGSTNVLHYSIKEPASFENFDFIKAIFVYMQRHSISVDLRDRKGRTALELAIRRDSTSLTKLILDHGASVEQQDAQGYRPLHTAFIVSASAATFRLIIRKGADPNICMPEVEQSRTLLSRASMALKPTQGPRHGDHLKYFDIISLLIDHGAGWSPSELREILGWFTYYWEASLRIDVLLEDVNCASESPYQLFASARLILQTYLDAGLHPSDIKSLGDSIFSDCGWATLLHAAIAHSRDLTLTNFIVSKTKSTTALCQIANHILLYGACATSKNSAPSSNGLNEALLATLLSIHQHPSDSFLLTALEMSSRDFKLQYIRTIMACRPHASMFSLLERRRFVNGMVRQDSGDRFEIAEAVLEPAMRRTHVVALGLPAMMRQAHNSAFQREPLSDITTAVEDYLGAQRCIQADTRIFVLCVLHVVTKDILTGAHKLSKEALIRVIRIRESNRLPDLTIPQKVVHDALGNDVPENEAGAIV